MFLKNLIWTNLVKCTKYSYNSDIKPSTFPFQNLKSFPTSVFHWQGFKRMYFHKLTLMSSRNWFSVIWGRWYRHSMCFPALMFSWRCLQGKFIGNFWTLSLEEFWFLYSTQDFTHGLRVCMYNIKLDFTSRIQWSLWGTRCDQTKMTALYAIEGKAGGFQSNFMQKLALCANLIVIFLATREKKTVWICFLTRMDDEYL